MKLVPTLLCDFYKISHRQQYPQGTEIVYSTWTPRSGKHANGITEVVAFGFQGVLKEILRYSIMDFSTSQNLKLLQNIVE